MAERIVITAEFVEQLHALGFCLMPEASVNAYADTIHELRVRNATLQNALETTRRLWARAGERN